MNDDLFQRLRRAYCSKDDPVPPGFKSRAQWQAEWKVGRSIANEMLAAGIREGILKTVKLRVGTSVIPFYGAVEPPHKQSTRSRKAR